MEKFWVVVLVALSRNRSGFAAEYKLDVLHTKVSIDQAVCVKLVKFLLYLVSRHGWLGLSTQPTPRELGGVEKFKALRDNGVMSGSRVEVVWMEVGSGIVRAKVVSRVVLGLVMKVVLVMLRGFWVEELALDAIEYDDQGMSMRKDVCRFCEYEEDDDKILLYTKGHTFNI
ncbi:hypothetical protein Tco_1079100 [Tanacetum coccineum]|uniref:Uncharacterized protein n=1 Tax=Tanacetum coccineum TaxID=301880 RepID=A0ABQ5HSF6_9ASTR